MEFGTTVALWAALIPIAGSAFLAATLAWRRDRHGFIDDKALTSLPILIAGILFAAFTASTPLLLLQPIANTPTTLDLGKVTVTDTWVWVASLVLVGWLYAVAASAFNTVMYHAQQRRLHDAGDHTT